MKVYKNGLERDIKDAALQDYQAAGWTTSQFVEQEKAVKPTVKSKGTVKETLDDAINTGEL